MYERMKVRTYVRKSFIIHLLFVRSLFIPLNPENLCANFAQNHTSRGLYFVRLSSTTIASLGTELEDDTCEDQRSRRKIRSCLIRWHDFLYSLTNEAQKHGEPLNKNFSVARNMMKKRSTHQRSMT